MTAKIDDLEAVRILAETLQPFASDDRERIIRWAREKLGMTASAATTLGSRAETTTDAPRDAVVTGSQGAVDIKKFVTEKAPKSDVHFAATVAYFHQFKSPENQRKDSITKEDLVEACRQVDRKRPKVPAQVLVKPITMGCLIVEGKAATSSIQWARISSQWRCRVRTERRRPQNERERAAPQREPARRRAHERAGSPWPILLALSMLPSMR